MDHHALVAALLLAAAAPGQDLLGIDFQGRLFVINTDNSSRTAVSANALGLGEHQAMGRVGGTLYVATRTGASPNHQYHIDAIDMGVLTTNRVMTNIGHDVIGLAGNPAGSPHQTTLHGIAQATPSDRLVRVNPLLGTVVPIGLLGFANVTALAWHDQVLYAWDTTFGLLTVDPQTGLATDVHPLIPGGTHVDFLAGMSDGRMLAGRDTLFRVDVSNGNLTALGGGAWSDLRGAEEIWGLARRFGVTCPTTFGTQTLSSAVFLHAGITVPISSGNHQAGSPGILVFGGSRTASGTTPLPLDLDPLLGTVGCSLFVSPDVTVFGTVLPNQAFTQNLVIPAGFAGSSFFVQQAVLEPVPGGISFTNGLELRIGF